MIAILIFQVQRRAIHVIYVERAFAINTAKSIKHATFVAIGFYYECMCFSSINKQQPLKRIKIK